MYVRYYNIKICPINTNNFGYRTLTQISLKKEVIE